MNLRQRQMHKAKLKAESRAARQSAAKVKPIPAPVVEKVEEEVAPAPVVEDAVVEEAPKAETKPKRKKKRTWRKKKTTEDQ